MLSLLTTPTKADTIADPAITQLAARASDVHDYADGLMRRASSVDRFEANDLAASLARQLLAGAEPLIRRERLAGTRDKDAAQRVEALVSRALALFGSDSIVADPAVTQELAMVSACVHDVLIERGEHDPSLHWGLSAWRVEVLDWTVSIAFGLVRYAVSADDGDWWDIGHES